MVSLALIRRAASMPEKQPLQALGALKVVFEAEDVVFVRKFLEVEELGAGFHDAEGWGLVVVDDDGDAPVGVETEEPLLLLVVGHDVAGVGC